MSGLNAVFEKAPSAVFGWNGFILDGALTSFFKLNYCEVSGIVKSGSTPSKSNGGFYINNRMFTNFEVLNSTFENNSVTNNGAFFILIIANQILLFFLIIIPLRVTHQIMEVHSTSIIN